MTRLLMIRHLPTAWNQAGRLQGRRDIGLVTPARRWKLPDDFAGYRVLSSPLARAVETACLLGVSAPEVDERLTEMDWGAWEGRSLAELRDTLGAAMTALEDRGLDFHPPGGESPREVQTRVVPLLAELAQEGRPTVAVTHKGVIRAVFARATGWDMLGTPPARLSWAAAHLFRLDTGGQPAVERLNIPLEPA